MTKIGDELIEALREVEAHLDGKAELVTHKVLVPDDVDVRAIREALGLSRPEFSRRFGFKARAVQEWEQRRRRPDPTARAYLTVIARNPRMVEEALSGAGH